MLHVLPWLRHTVEFVLRFGILLPTVVLAGCSYGPEWYALPPQRTAITAPPTELAMYITMNDPAAARHLVRDIGGLEDNLYRWTSRRPELEFWLLGARRIKFAMSFALPDVTMKVTGPVTLSILINGQPFDQPRYDQPGNHQYEKDVPPELLKARARNSVVIEPRPVWKGPDGRALGFVLTEAGFRY